MFVSPDIENKLEAQTLSLYQQMEEDNTKLLQTYKQDLEMYSTKLKHQAQECKIALQRGSDIQVYDTGHEIQSSATLPVKPTLCTASFSPNRNPQGHLEQAFGEVNTSDQCQGQGLLGSSTGQRLPSTQHRSKGEKELTSPVYILLPQTKVLGELISPCDITSVCPITDGQVWTSYFYSNTLTLLDRKGKVIQEVTHNAEIIDISLSPTTNTLWICDRKNNITELVSGGLVHSEGSLPEATGTGKPLVCRPYRISECPVTHNVAVVDFDNKNQGGEGKPRFVVMDTDFKELFVYGGEVLHTYQPPSQSEGERFNPYGVVYDSVGNLVIGDFNNKSVVLISGCGEFLRILHKDGYCAYAIRVHKKDVLWVVFGVNKVKLLHYSSV
ncbi:uncharacterized protein LOC110464052 [Mizuhopecten yessoensis]|uniref:uncharacterized protein LOC110464052 n=1 Tax=Mizuhopecten yessoensis TaxID=6573 RepID=UPI000B45BF82|nr:uncharacterized protein LOC110464052 [Mizuhopecten yessoensis]